MLTSDLKIAHAALLDYEFYRGGLEICKSIPEEPTYEFLRHEIASATHDRNWGNAQIFRFLYELLMEIEREPMRTHPKFGSRMPQLDRKSLEDLCRLSMEKAERTLKVQGVTGYMG